MASKVVGILSLGTRSDAARWQNGCETLGMIASGPIRKARPKLAELKAFFLLQPHWIFFGGHFDSRGLFNDRELSQDEGAVKIEFNAGGVSVVADGKRAKLTRKDREFRLHTNCEVMLWGGCNVCTSDDTIRELMNLFNNPLLLGFAGTTSPALINKVIDSSKHPVTDDVDHASKHFFERISDSSDRAVVRDAWLETTLHVYGNSSTAARFRAIDPNGQEWEILKGKVQKGRKFSL